MSRERAIYFAGLMKEYLNIPSCVCENIENELINEKYYKVINYIIDRKKEYKEQHKEKEIQYALIEVNKKYKEAFDKVKKIILQPNIEIREYRSCDMDYVCINEQLLEILNEVSS